jgi:hypothetical protein
VRNIVMVLTLFAAACGGGVVVEVIHVDASGAGEGEGEAAGEGEGEGVVVGEGEGEAAVVGEGGDAEGEAAGDGEGEAVVDDGSCDEDDVPLVNAGVVAPAGLDGCPAGMAPVGGAFCMDRWEAFLERADGAPFSPFAHPGGVDVVARSAPGAVPQGYISGLEAGAACAAAGKRLCSDSEWLRACQGAATTTYPYGDVRQPGLCNDARSQHPAMEFFGTAADWIWSELGHPCINQQHDTVDPAGENPGCVDDEGTHFDLMGNLHEWTDDPAGTFRGGYYVDTRINGEGCLYRTTAHDRGHWDYSTGFRCCADR